MSTEAEDPSHAGGPDSAEFARRTIEMHSDPRFRQLKSRLRWFIFPMSIAFLAWYLLYVLMSAFARDFMSIVLFGQINVALVFGILQFASTFGIAILYSSYANRKLDPLSSELHAELTGPAKRDEGAA